MTSRTIRRRWNAFAVKARAASALNHPNICTIHEIASHDGQWFIVMEFMDGDTLKHRIGGRPLELEALLFHRHRDCRRAGSGGNAQDIVHRDVKPANIFCHQARLDEGP